MDNPSRAASSIGIALILTLGVHSQAAAQRAAARTTAAGAVSSFYTFHLAHNKDFTVPNVRQRRPWLTADLYGLLLKELTRQAEYSKKHPDEAPYFEGDPLTDSQEYPDSFLVGSVVANANRAKATVTLNWSAKSSRGSDMRKIAVELIKVGSEWLINDIINNEGASLRADLQKEH